MKKFKKYIAIRLIALMLFPYSASAAAACHTQLDYSAGNTPDLAYEAAAYKIDPPITNSACSETLGTLSEAQINNADLLNSNISSRNSI